MAYVKEISDERGDIVELQWFCEEHRPDDAHALDEAVDYPEYCAVCGMPVGNLLTAEGINHMLDLALGGDGRLLQAYEHELDVCGREPAQVIREDGSLDGKVIAYWVGGPTPIRIGVYGEEDGERLLYRSVTWERYAQTVKHEGRWPIPAGIDFEDEMSDAQHDFIVWA